MEFVLENIDKNKYSGELIFYWLDRDITFRYDISRLKEDKMNNLILKLNYKIKGRYRLGHNLKNKVTNNFDEQKILINSNNILELNGGFKKRLEWIYFEIKKIENEIILSEYDKDKFRYEEKELKSRSIKMNIEYWNIYWKCLHLISYLYSNEPSKESKDSILKLLIKLETDGLKCINCKNHFINYIQSLDRQEIVKDKESLINFFIDLHNNINRRNGKKELNRVEVNKLYSDKKNIISELLKVKINISKMLEENRVNEFPDIYNREGRRILKKKWGLFVLEK